MGKHLVTRRLIRCRACKERQRKVDVCAFGESNGGMTTRQKSGLAAYLGSLIALIGVAAAYFAFGPDGAVNAILLIAACIAFVVGGLLASKGIAGLRGANE